MTNIRGLIFDLDGVIANTIALHYEAWEHIAATHGLSFGNTEMETFRGRRRAECLQLLFAPEPLDQQRIQALSALKDTVYLDALERAAVSDLLLPGVHTILETAQQLSLKLGLASSSANARFVLARAALTLHFDAIADGHTVARSKPEPDIFVWTAGGLRLHPTEIIVFEDSQAGIQAAQSAGCVVVGIGGPAQHYAPDFHYDDLAAIDLPKLLDRVAERRTSHSTTSAITRS